MHFCVQRATSHKNNSIFKPFDIQRSARVNFKCNKMWFPDIVYCGLLHGLLASMKVLRYLMGGSEIL